MQPNPLVHTNPPAPSPGWTVAPNIVLRPLQAADAQALFSLIETGRLHLGEFLPWVNKTLTPADSAEFIAACQKDWEVGTAAHWGTFYAGDLVGHLSLMNIKPGHKGEIGYWLAKPAVGQGIMTQAVQSVVSYAFGERGLVRVFIRCRASNARSAAIPQRLGFTYEGRERLGEHHRGRFYDYDTYGLLREDRKNPQH